MAVEGDDIDKSKAKLDSDNAAVVRIKLAAANKRLVLKLLCLVVGAIAFAFALVPFYNLVCSATGLNGKTSNTASTIAKAQVDNSRVVTVEFVGNVMTGLGWNFAPKQASITLHPGQIASVLFEAKNTTGEELAGQAIPSVTPGEGAAYLKKIECFCFQRQTLKPGEVREMPLRFFIDPDLPKEVKVMTLSYSFYPAVEVKK